MALIMRREALCVCPTFQFCRHLRQIAEQISLGVLTPPKTQRYLDLYLAGLPVDNTVRWFPGWQTGAARDRVGEFARLKLETWVSFATPTQIDKQTSVQGLTPLVKGIHSVRDFDRRVIPELEELEPGTWLKLFYETERKRKEKLISGALMISDEDYSRGIDAEMVMSWGTATDLRLVASNKVFGSAIRWSRYDDEWRDYHGRLLQISGFTN